MDTYSAHTVTSLLHAAGAGDGDAFNKLFDQLYSELHHLAGMVRSNGAADTLNTTAIVHEAYIKLIPSSERTWHNRMHFLRVATMAMRQVVVQYARYKKAEKRGNDQADFTFSDTLYQDPSITPDMVLHLDEALNRLEQLDQRQAKIVEYRFFAGLNVDDTAGLMEISTATVKRDWRMARAWLISELERAAS